MDKPRREGVSSVVDSHAVGDWHLLIGAEQKVGHGVTPGRYASTGTLAIKGKAWRSEKCLKKTQVQVLETNFKRMPAADPVDVLLYLVDVGDELHGTPGTQDEAAADVELRRATVGIHRHFGDAQVRRQPGNSRCAQRVLACKA